MSDLVTGEAVVLGLRTAKLPSRALAVLMDLFVEFAGLAVTAIVLGFTLTDLDDAAFAALTLGLMVFFLVAVPVIVETLSRGRSLGKAVFGLRVVRGDGGPVRFRHSLVRGITGFFEINVLGGVPAVISSAVSPQGKRLGDLFAGTMVVRERVPGGKSGPALPPVPPQLLQAMSGELVSLDLSAVPEPLWLAIRQLLGRIGELDQPVAHELSARLAGDLAAHTGHPVPYGLHPAGYLGAVLVERQRREWARAQGFAAQQAAQAAQAAQAVPHSVPQGGPYAPPIAPVAVPAAPDGELSPLTTAPMPAVAPKPAAPSPSTPPPAASTGFAPPA
ncbi:RDD family protein [Kitasatospora sp. NPDC004240]